MKRNVSYGSVTTMTDDCRKVTDGETQVIINITTGANTIAVSPSQASFSSGLQYISSPFLGSIVLMGGQMSFILLLVDDLTSLVHCTPMHNVACL